MRVESLIDELEKLTGSRDMASEVLAIVWRWQSYRLIERPIMSEREHAYLNRCAERALK